MSLLKRLAAVAGISVMTAGIMIGSSAPAFAQDTDAGSQNEAAAYKAGVSFDGVPEDADSYTLVWPDGSEVSYTSYDEVVKASKEERQLGTFTTDGSGDIKLENYSVSGKIRLYEAVVPDGYTADERSVTVDLEKKNVNVVNHKQAQPVQPTDPADNKTDGDGSSGAGTNDKSGGDSDRKASANASDRNVVAAKTQTAPVTGDKNYTPLWAGIVAGAVAAGVIAVLIKKKKAGLLIVLLSAGAVGAASIAGISNAEAAQLTTDSKADFYIHKTDDDGNPVGGAGFEVYAFASDIRWEYDPVPASKAETLLSKMPLDQKIAQMIMPALRCWEVWGNNVTDLSQFPEVAEGLRRHQYGGVILFGQNITDTEQTTRLTNALQVNNAAGEDAKETGVIPYLISADQEGGAVARLSNGTRGTGSMAIGATDEEASDNAFAIGRVFGEELAALGINVNLAPCIDIISDLTDLGLSTRVYSDDPQKVADLGLSFKAGLDQSNVITTFKHFPGAGDGSDYPTSIKITMDQLREKGLYTYSQAIANGAEMLMTSATTFPLIDDEYVMADGVTKGHYPATLSKKLVNDLLREEMGFDGVVITDALEMEQFVTEPDNGAKLFPGEKSTLEHALQVAKYSINAGCDMLLIPTDMINADSIDYYDGYIKGLEDMVNSGEISIDRIDQSALRILKLKERHGILDMDASGNDIEEKVNVAKRVVGSEAHHDVEKVTAAQAVTLLKNDSTLPLAGGKKRVVIIGRSTLDDTPIRYALTQLEEGGVIGADTYINDRIKDETTGDENAEVSVFIDNYINNGQINFTDELSDAIKNADAVICLSSVSAGIEQLQDSSLPIQALKRAVSETHAAGGKFIFLSANLPVDAARFQEADAIVSAYLASGYNVDPTARTSRSENVGAFNANVPAALCAIFGMTDMPGKLPINIPVMEQNTDGQWEYTDKILYERGYSAAVK